MKIHGFLKGPANLIILMLLCKAHLFSQVPFLVIDTNSQSQKLLLPVGMKYESIFWEGEIVTSQKNQRAASKGGQGHAIFIPGNKILSEGLLYVAHERNDSSKTFGDGGGGTLVAVKKIEDVWVTSSKYHNIDFSKVGATCMNTGVALLNKERLLVCENALYNSNKELSKNKKGIRDTSDFNGYKKWQHMGWVVEVNLHDKKAVRKLYPLGRFSHEGLLIMPDSLTVYLTDNHAPAVFFKFIALTPNNFSQGNLYAYKQSTDGLSGTWISLPMQKDSLIMIREVALRAGATMFLKLGGLCLVNEKIYITEEGGASFIPEPKTCFNGIPAHHLNSFSIQQNHFQYPEGGLLVFDTGTNQMSPLLFGGSGIIDKAKKFNNPQSLIGYQINDDFFLLIGEAWSRKEKRLHKAEQVLSPGKSELWWLDLSIIVPSIDNLNRFMSAPPEAILRGGAFTPDYKTLFLSVQHPSSKNKPPFNRSVTVAITGFKDKLIREKRIKGDHRQKKGSG